MIIGVLSSKNLNIYKIVIFLELLPTETNVTKIVGKYKPVFEQR